MSRSPNGLAPVGDDSCGEEESSPETASLFASGAPDFLSGVMPIEPAFAMPQIKRMQERSKSKQAGRRPTNTLRETFLDELADIYDAEKQLIKALPKVAEAAEHEDLKRGFQQHLEETEEHVTRLERVFEIFGEEPKSRRCKAMKGLLEEGEEHIEDEDGDAALICAAQKIEHYEIASYGSLVSWARLLGEEDAADVLEETLDEEKATDEKLTSLAESVINVDESQKAAESEESE